ncbi:Uncharacterized protein HZ326_27316 [Fusarium oxysporum f. sp. albedinis]|nr:Uncharacterized protein HZ326_27316 [Fusarium oxysporum f. sp. albedinis]
MLAPCTGHTENRNKAPATGPAVEIFKPPIADMDSISNGGSFNQSQSRKIQFGPDQMPHKIGHNPESLTVIVAL